MRSLDRLGNRGLENKINFLSRVVGFWGDCLNRFLGIVFRASDLFFGYE